jgi:hypothetical protein
VETSETSTGKPTKRRWVLDKRYVDIGDGVPMFVAAVFLLILWTLSILRVAIAFIDWELGDPIMFLRAMIVLGTFTLIWFGVFYKREG